MANQEYNNIINNKRPRRIKNRPKSPNFKPLKIIESNSYYILPKNPQFTLNNITEAESQTEKNPYTFSFKIGNKVENIQFDKESSK